VIAVTALLAGRDENENVQVFFLSSEDHDGSP
jgi:hypothetical protein